MHRALHYMGAREDGQVAMTWWPRNVPCRKTLWLQPGTLPNEQTMLAGFTLKCQDSLLNDGDKEGMEGILSLFGQSVRWVQYLENNPKSYRYFG